MKNFSTVSEYDVINAAYTLYLELWSRELWSREIVALQENPEDERAYQMRHYYWGICEELHEELLILDKKLGKMVDLFDKK